MVFNGVSLRLLLFPQITSQNGLGRKCDKLTDYSSRRYVRIEPVTSRYERPCCFVSSENYKKLHP